VLLRLAALHLEGDRKLGSIRSNCGSCSCTNPGAGPGPNGAFSIRPCDPALLLPRRPKSRHAWYIGCVLAVASAALSSCGTTPSDESCRQFESQSTSAQKAVVTKLAEAHGTADPSPAYVDETLASAAAYCFLHSSSAMVSGIYSG